MVKSDKSMYFAVKNFSLHRKVAAKVQIIRFSVISTWGLSWVYMKIFHKTLAGNEICCTFAVSEMTNPVFSAWG